MPKRKETKRVKELFQKTKEDLPSPEKVESMQQNESVAHTVEEATPPTQVPDLEKIAVIDISTSHNDGAGLPETTMASATSQSTENVNPVVDIKPEEISEQTSHLEPVSFESTTQVKSTGVADIINQVDTGDLKEDDQLLVNEVANELGLALENARLYVQAQDELSERIRAEQVTIRRNKDLAAITQAIALLTEQGSRALPLVLKTLGESTESDRIYYGQIREDESGAYWRATQRWCPPELDAKFDHTKLARLPVASFPTWANELHSKGWAGANFSSAPSIEHEYLTNQGIQSTLWVAVTGRTATPSFIAFERLEKDQTFKAEEINAYKVVADGLSNTFTRETLLEQLQLSLDETENLYNASHKLALATDLNEMVAAITQALVVPALNRGVLLMFEKSPEDKLLRIIVAANWFSGRGTPPPPIQSEYSLTIFKDFLSRQSAEFFDDIYDVQITAPVQEELNRQGVSALGVLPLWAGKRQIGALLLEFGDRHHFSNRELRSYPPLVDQMATSVENLRLFQQTQAALAETELLYKISNGVAQANDAKDLNNLIINTVLPKSASLAAISILIHDGTGKPAELEILASGGSSADLLITNKVIPVSSLPVVDKLINDPIYIEDIDSSVFLDQTSKETLKSLNFKCFCLTPLRSAGGLSGVLFVNSNSPSAFSADEIRLLNLAAGGISVAIERQRLLREAQRRALELQTAAEIARDTTSTLSLDQLLKRFVNQIRDRFNFYHVAIFLADQINQFAVIREGTGDIGIALKSSEFKQEIGSNTIVGQSCKTGEPVIVNDVSTSNLFAHNSLLPDTKSEICIPLKIGGKVTGVLDIQSNVVNAFTQNEIAVLQILADQIAVAIENSRAFELSQKAVEEMHEIDRIKNQFMANMSHELRTPLNSIIGFSRVILKGIDGPVNEIQAQDLAAIYTSGQHLLSLINNILDLSKIEAGKMELQYSEINLADVINGALSTASGLIKDKPIKLEQIIQPDLPVVKADQTRIRQVLINFISNAVKFTESGSITVEAKKAALPNGQAEIMVIVTDTGTGIAEKDRAKLFQPFSQVDDSPTRKAGGTGLGLSISRSIIEMHHGRIGLLESTPGKGSKFFFTLPLMDEEKVKPTLTPSTTGNTILAIDDNPDILSLYERYLKPHGYDVYSLTNPEDALETAKKIHPFAILVDIMMPQKDGWSVIRDLKADPLTQYIPVVIASIVEEKERGLKLGAADYLVKPFLQEDLVNAVNRLNQSGSIKKILVIDDDNDDLRLLQKMFGGMENYKLITASSGHEGLEQIHSEQPDAIILNLFMHDIDGFTLYEMVQSDPVFANTPVLFLTGADLTPIQSQLVAEFGQKLLTKGMLKEDDLLKSLQDAMNRTKK
jgi:signal transduction histidine kinase/DNA-binding response OmpR family regulator